MSNLDIFIWCDIRVIVSFSIRVCRFDTFLF